MMDPDFSELISKDDPDFSEEVSITITELSIVTSDIIEQEAGIVRNVRNDLVKML